MAVPGTIFWEVTSACNLNCVHCYLGKQGAQKSSFPPTTAEKYVDILAGGGVETILFMGGEPLIYPPIYDLVRKTGTLGHGLHAGVLTNGTPLTKRVVAKLKQNGVSAVQVSIDGTGSSYEQIRGVAFNKVGRGVDNLKEQSILTQAKYTINKKNLAAFDDVLAYCRKKRIRLSTSITLPIGNAIAGVVPLPEDYFELVLKMFQAKQRLQMEDEYLVLPDFAIEEYLQEGEPATSCVAASGISGITYDNRFVPCIYLSGVDTVKLFGIETPIFGEDFVEVFENHALFRLFREEAATEFGCPIRKRLNNGRDPFSVYAFADWYVKDNA